MGNIIALDHKAVLGDIRLYFAADKVKRIFEGILECFRIEQEYEK